MKRIFLILAIIMIGPFNLGCAQQENPYLYDFGSVKEGDILIHTFIYKNPSQRPVKIGDLQPSCVCTQAEAKTKDILPGGSAEIKVTVNSADRAGDMTQYVYVQTDNPSEPVSKLVVKAKVVPE
jgi:hypothetical protein